MSETSGFQLATENTHALDEARVLPWRRLYDGASEIGTKLHCLVWLALDQVWQWGGACELAIDVQGGRAIGRDRALERCPSFGRGFGLYCHGLVGSDNREGGMALF